MSVNLICKSYLFLFGITTSPALELVKQRVCEVKSIAMDKSQIALVSFKGHVIMWTKDVLAILVAKQNKSQIGREKEDLHAHHKSQEPKHCTPTSALKLSQAGVQKPGEVLARLWCYFQIFPVYWHLITDDQSWGLLRGWPTWRNWLEITRKNMRRHEETIINHDFLMSCCSRNLETLHTASLYSAVSWVGASNGQGASRIWSDFECWNLLCMLFGQSMFQQSEDESLLFFL